MEDSQENWAMTKDTIDLARAALEIGLENTLELLTDHDSRLGRSTRSNRLTAERLEGETLEIRIAIAKLEKPDGRFVI